MTRSPRAAAIPTAAAALLVGGCEEPPSLPPETPTPAEAVQAIRNADIRRIVSLLAHDSLRGRETGTAELRQAASWVAGRFRAAGLQPGGGEDYFQVFPYSLGAEGRNVIGWLGGSDPDLRAEYVALAAHLDHLGVGVPEGNDSIRNGADDNASGVAALVELAEAFGRLRPAPRRSLVFFAFDGEEGGLWGSRYFVDHPTLPVERFVAVLNMDMIGRNFRDSIVAIGRERSELGTVAERVAAEHPELSLQVVGDLWPEEQLFARSDHFPFHQRAGVPVLFFTSGLHEDYHRPGDEPHLLDYEKTTRVARLLFYVGLEIAGGTAAGG